MEEERPSPEQLLAQVQGPAPTEHGALKIFFGYAPGVGKTYAMLEEARELALSGEDVLVGYVEPHVRRNTELLVLGLDLLPTVHSAYRGIELREFDLDAALTRRPRVIIVDELAHTNVAGSRHAKRWQDVQELLEAGIDVFSTLNLQHLESLNDTVAKITGIVVRETVPDDIFDRAADVQLIDIPADALLERFQAGKVYVPEQAERAMRSFFTRDKLTALRELMLRRAADRVSRQLRESGGRTVVQSRERLLVCVGPSPTSARVIRSARRMATALGADWIAACVETSATENLRKVDRERLARHMQLAERLGAELATLHGDNVAHEIVTYAKRRGVTQIVAGKTEYDRRLRWGRRSLVEELVRHSGDVDVFVIRGRGEPLRFEPYSGPRTSRWSVALTSSAVLSLCTLVGLLFERVGLADADVIMVYLLGVVAIAARLGAMGGITASVMAVLLFNFFFTKPYYTFHVDNPGYVFTFLAMGLTALATSMLMARMRRQAEESRKRERRTEALYRLNQQLTNTMGLHQLAGAAERYLSEVYAGQVVLLAPDARGHLAPITPAAHAPWLQPNEIAVAQWVHDHRRPAGRGTDTLASAAALYIPLQRSHGTLGVLGLRAEAVLSPEQQHLLATFAAQLALALERDDLAAQAQRALFHAEHERLRSALLSSVSHDLRTPLTIIALASSNVLRQPDLNDTARRELDTVLRESQRLTRLVENLLHMTRLESESMQVNKQWQPIEETIGSALARAEPALQAHPVNVRQPDDLVLAPYDGVLIEQTLINLVENAAKYSSSSQPIQLTVRKLSNAVEVEVADRGPGIARGDEERIFEKFYRGESVADRARGTGLGLAICKAIIQAHGGEIGVRNRPDGGASFRFTLPLTGTQPGMPEDLVASDGDNQLT